MRWFGWVHQSTVDTGLAVNPMNRVVDLLSIIRKWLLDETLLCEADHCDAIHRRGGECSGGNAEFDAWRDLQQKREINTVLLRE